MGSATQIGELTLGVYGNGVILDFVQELELVSLPELFEQRPGFGHRQFPSLKRQILSDDLPHPLFDVLQVIGSERLRLVKIVIKSVFDGGTDGDLDIGIERFDGLGHDVGGRMAENIQSLSGIGADKTNVGVIRGRSIQIDEFPVHIRRHRFSAHAVRHSTQKCLPP